MISFACMNFGPSGTDILIILGVALTIGMIVTGSVALLISWMFDASMLKTLVLVAAVLSFVAGVAYSLGIHWEGTLALSLLGAASCVVLLVVNLLYSLVRGKAPWRGDQEFCSLELVDRPTLI
jgi:hypothetical protein